MTSDGYSSHFHLTIDGEGEMNGGKMVDWLYALVAALFTPRNMSEMPIESDGNFSHNHTISTLRLMGMWQLLQDTQNIVSGRRTNTHV